MVQPDLRVTLRLGLELAFAAASAFYPWPCRRSSLVGQGTRACPYVKHFQKTTYSSLQHSVPLWSYFLQIVWSTVDRVCNPRGNGIRCGKGKRRFWSANFWQSYDIQHREHRSIRGQHCTSAAGTDCCNNKRNAAPRLRLQIFNTSTAPDAILTHWQLNNTWDRPIDSHTSFTWLVIPTTKMIPDDHTASQALLCP